MTYKTTDGELLTADSPDKLIEALRDGGRFTSQQSLPVFMAGLAERTREWSGHTLRTDTPANFLADLVTAGQLTKVE